MGFTLTEETVVEVSMMNRGWGGLRVSALIIAALTILLLADGASAAVDRGAGPIGGSVAIKETCAACGNVYGFPMTEDDVEDELATIFAVVQCCCIKNVTAPTYSNDTLVDDFSCCGSFSLLCDTRRRDVATNPHAESFEDSINKRNPDSIPPNRLELGSPVFEFYTEVYCDCTPSSYNTTCSISSWGDVFWSFVCESCQH